MEKFKVGDIVRLEHGWTRMIVVGTSRGKVQAKYSKDPKYDNDVLNSRGCEAKNRYPSGFRFWDEDKNERKNDMSKLYKVTKGIDANGPEKYGTYLTKDSQGNYVLEMKGGGGVQSFPKDHLEEVVPFTFEVRHVGNSGYTCHYEGKAGTFKEGDIIQSKTGNIYIVTDLDTKVKSPKGEFKGWILNIEKTEV